MPIDGDISDFSRHAGMPSPEAVPQRNGTSDPRAHGYEQHALGRLIFPLLQLGHRRSIDVVVHHAGYAECVGQLVGQWYLSPAVQHDAGPRNSTGKIHLAGKADSRSAESAAGIAQLLGCIEHQPTRLLRTGRTAGGSDRAPDDRAVLLGQAGE
jgi:hypothetical protein